MPCAYEMQPPTKEDTAFRIFYMATAVGGRSSINFDLDPKQVWLGRSSDFAFTENRLCYSWLRPPLVGPSL